MTYVPQALRTVPVSAGLWIMVSDGIIFYLPYCVIRHSFLRQLRKKRLPFWAVWLTGCCVILVSYLAGVTFFSPSILIILSALLYGSIFCGKTPGICGNICIGFHAKVDRRTLRCCISGDGRDARSGDCDRNWDAGSADGCFVSGLFLADPYGYWTGKPVSLRESFQSLVLIHWRSMWIHYQFATVLNPDKIAYAFWSVEGLLYAAAAFVAMRCDYSGIDLYH